MDALVHTTAPNTTASVTLFTGEAGKGLHRVYFYNTDELLPATLYIRVQEGTTGEQMTLSKLTIEPQTDKKWIGTIGADDSFILESQNPYQSTFVDADNGTQITTEDGIQLGDANNITINYSWW